MEIYTYMLSNIVFWTSLFMIVAITYTNFHTKDERTCKIRSVENLIFAVACFVTNNTRGINVLDKLSASQTTLWNASFFIGIVVGVIASLCYLIKAKHNLN